MIDVDCDICRHQDDDDFCNECEHAAHEYYDHFDPISDDEIKRKNEEALKRAIQALTDKVITTKVDPILFTVFNQVKKFTAAPDHHYPIFAAVYFNKGYICATDSHRLIEIKCDVPPELYEKHVLSINENSEVTLARRPVRPSPLETNSYKFIFETPRKTLSVTKKSLIDLFERTEKYPDYLTLKLPGLTIFFQERYIKDTLDCLPDDGLVELRFKDELSAVIFVSGNVTIAVLPVRTVEAEKAAAAS